MAIRTEMFVYSSTLSWMPYGDTEGEGHQLESSYPVFWIHYE